MENPMADQVDVSIGFPVTGEPLGNAKRLSDMRNEYLHSAGSVSNAGMPILKSEADHSWGEAPSKEQVTNAARDILALGKEINDQRLCGFIDQVTKRPIAKT
jgi:hypothetical protein